MNALEIDNIFEYEENITTEETHLRTQFSPNRQPTSLKEDKKETKFKEM